MAVKNVSVAYQSFLGVAGKSVLIENFQILPRLGNSFNDPKSNQN
jgi:hypothetical protein